MTEQQYSIAIRRRKDNNDRFFQNKNFEFEEIRIKSNYKYWFADPFVFEYNNVTYLFYEAYDLVEQRGKLAYSILNDDNTATKPKIILDRVYHFSFPYIFECNNQIYIMPETCADNNLQLFRAVSFPDKWEENTVLLNDVFVSDSIILDSGTQKYVSCFEQYKEAPRGKLFYCWGKNKIYEISDNRLINGKVVAEGDYGIRNAGAVFRLDDKIIRVGQDSTDNQYGKGLVFFAIDEITPYRESEIYSIDANKMKPHIKFSGAEKNIDGTHTYNSSEHYEIIDFSYVTELPLKIRLMRSFKIRLRRLLKKLRGR